MSDLPPHQSNNRDTQTQPVTSAELLGEKQTKKYPHWLNSIPFPKTGCPRFWATLNLLVLIAFVNDVLLPMLTASLPSVIGAIVSLAFASFALQWLYVYPSAYLHLQRRAHFDEANIVATYHTSSKYNPDYVFVADPPTPAPTDEQKALAAKVTFASDAPEEPETSSHQSFKAKRDDHYRNEFERAQQMLKDIRMTEELVNQQSSSSQSELGKAKDDNKTNSSEKKQKRRKKKRDSSRQQ